MAPPPGWGGLSLGRSSGRRSEMNCCYSTLKGSLPPLPLSFISSSFHLLPYLLPSLLSSLLPFSLIPYSFLSPSFLFSFPHSFLASSESDSIRTQRSHIHSSELKVQLSSLMLPSRTLINSVILLLLLQSTMSFR